MKLILCISAAILFEASIAFGSSLNADGSFQGAKWGEHLDQFKGVVLIGKKDQRSVFFQERTLLKMDKADIKSAYLHFMSDELCAIELRTIDGETLLVDLLAILGKPKKVEAGVGKFQWEFDGTTVIMWKLAYSETSVAYFIDRTRVPEADPNRLVYAKEPAIARAQATSPGASSSQSADPCGPGRHWVSGYTTKRGKFVSGHCANNPH